MSNARATVQETVFANDVDGSLTGSGAHADTVTAIIAWLQELRDSVPEQYRDECFVTVMNFVEYNNSRPRIEVYYHRPETDKEMASRLAAQKYYAAQSEQHERLQYEALKAKYG